jgi:hypothetical protein
MPSNTILNDYEVASEGAVRHWEIPIVGRLDTVGGAAASSTNSVPSRACAVIGDTPGVQLTGTILSQDTSGTDRVVVDFTAGMVYKHQVRNVTAYEQAAESTWAAINIGDQVYYDRTNTNARLSTTATDSGGVNPNPLFGFVVPWSNADMANYPKGGITASTQTCAIIQVGAGAEGSDAA